MNRISEQILEQRKGHYCHALEVENVYHLESVIESLVGEFHKDFSLEEITDFICSMELYCLVEENEEEVYNFNINEYIKENYHEQRNIST